MKQRQPFVAAATTVLLITSLLVSAAGSAAAQRIVASESTVGCAGCRLIIDSVTTLGGKARVGDSIPGFVGKGQILRTSDGRVIVGSGVPLQVFDQFGRPSAEISRLGTGPAEFPYPPMMSARRGDGQLFFLLPTRRVLQYDSDLQFVRTFSLAQPTSANVLLPRGGFAGISSRPAGMSAGDIARQPLFTIFSDSGAVVREVGSERTLADGIIAPAPDGTIWTATKRPYQLKQWSADGELLTVISRPFKGMEGIPYGVPRPPQEFAPVVADVRIDSFGRIWVAVLKPRGTSTSGDVPHAGQFAETVLEVVDPRTGNLLATANLTTPVREFMDDGYLASVLRSVPEFGTMIVLYRATLVIPE